MIEFFNKKSIKDIKEEKDNRKLSPDEVVDMIKDLDTNLDQVTESMEVTNMETMGAIAELFETSQNDKTELMGAIAEIFEMVAGGADEPLPDEGDKENPTDEPVVKEGGEDGIPG